MMFFSRMNSNQKLTSSRMKLKYVPKCCPVVLRVCATALTIGYRVYTIYMYVENSTFALHKMYCTIAFDK